MSVTNIAYGKSRVRLTRIGPDALTELAVEVALAGDFAAAYTDGDNSRVVATDSMKNIVLAHAADHALERKLTEAELTHIRAKNAELIAQWIALPHGESLELPFTLKETAT